MRSSAMIRGALGAVLVGAGIALLASARSSLGCTDCEDDPQATITDVAKASAARVRPAPTRAVEDEGKDAS